MAMIKCPECGKEVSDRARNCPSCGYPICEIQDDVMNNDVMASQNNDVIFYLNDQAVNMTQICMFAQDKIGCIEMLRRHYNFMLELDTATAMVENYLYIGYGTSNFDKRQNVPTRYYSKGIANGASSVKSNYSNGFANRASSVISNENFNNTQKKQKKKDSGMSLAAAICAFFTYTCWLGIIFAIIDLVKNKNDGKRHLGSYFALVMGSLVLIVAIATGNKSNDKNGGTNSAQYSQNIDKNASNTNASNSKVDNSQSTKKEDPGIATASDFKKMSVGDIGTKGDVYVGLSYVKRSSYLPTALGEHTDIASGHEVILAFFDIYNNSDKSTKVYPGDITCYADGVQVEDVENYINVECDGISQYYTEDIADHTQLISVQDFEVATGWKELKFFYKSDLVWVVSQSDVKSDDFKFSSMYNNLTISRTPTAEGTVIFKDGYEVIFKGVATYVHSNMVWGDTSYVIFKFTVNNTGSTPIDYSLAGYEMTGYINNYYAGNASFALDDKIDGFSNIYNIDTIEAGMSANIYLAYKGTGEGASLYMIYDDGYITNKVRGAVYIEP